MTEPYDHDSPRDADAGEAWLAASSYLPLICFLPYVFHRGRDFVAYHARQGVLLFLFEIVGALALWIVDASLGRIPFLGILLSVILRLAFYLPVLALMVLGFSRALTGERGPLPWIGHFADRIPDFRSGPS